MSRMMLGVQFSNDFFDASVFDGDTSTDAGNRLEVIGDHVKVLPPLNTKVCNLAAQLWNFNLCG